MSILKEFRQALFLALALLLVCGVVYPYTLTGLGGLLSKENAQGSLLYMDGKLVGSALVGQEFTDPRFLRGRPSAVAYNTYTVAQKADGTYGGLASGSENMGASNPALAERVRHDLEAFLKGHPSLKVHDIPTDLLTASGSGLDPHISPESARIQIPALARHTGLSKERLTAMIDTHTTGKWAGVFGGETVHVLKVNIDIARALDIPPHKGIAQEKE